jgi:hypothetical protein
VWDVTQVLLLPSTWIYLQEPPITNWWEKPPTKFRRWWRLHLWYKLNSTQADVGGSGTRMPPELTLADSDLALFQSWIEMGAQ